MNHPHIAVEAGQGGRLILLTVKEAAAFLAISREAVYRLCESRRLAHHRFGNGRGTIRIHRDDLASFAATCRVEAKPDDFAEFDHLR